MKAAMQGRTDCVRALMLAGADLEARDDGRRLTPRQWALFTGRHETAHLMLRLMTQPCPEQYRDSYRAEWPRLPELVASAREPRGWLHKLSETVRGALSFAAGSEPADGGVLDHMVRATTGLTSPFVATACRTVCPGSPPCVSKRRYSVQEILRRERGEPLQSPDPERHGDHGLVSRHFRATLAPRRKDRRPSAEDAARQRHGSLLATRPARRGSVRPDAVLPKLRVTKAPPPDYEPEKSRKKSSCKDEHFLQIPKWRYKELKEERKKAEEAEKKKMEEAERKRVVARRLLLTGKRK
ncbi:ankyrin repeat domain-containing protein 33B isoform X2 [Anguilla anguilla]|nr:ankyrin repeat domain-containing protein 33B isoform X2 [Anguilla anguilla]